MSDEFFMSEALREAEKAAEHGDVPVGAVIVKDGQIIARGHNERELNGSPTAHAEICAIEAASKKLSSWHLDDCTLFVTLEPCPMCAGAIINSRIKRVVFSSSDAKAGAMGSLINLCDHPFNHIPTVDKGVLAHESAEMMKSFFSELRKE